MGELRISNGDLSLVIPIDISYFKPHLDSINSVLGTFRYLCKQSDVIDDLTCHHMLSPLTIRYEDLNKNLASLSHIILNRNKKRSAWFGAVGTVFKHIFGTLDENDALNYNRAIENVQNNQIKMASIVKNNILVTSSYIKSFNETLYKFNMNQAVLNNALDELSLNIKNISDKLVIRSKLEYILNMLESSLLSISFKLEDLTNSLLFIKNNIIHPSIITPMQIYQELIENHSNLPSSRELPVSLELQNINIILNISQCISYFYDNKIVFILRIPLVDNKIYDIYHVMPLPMSHSDGTSYVCIIPSTKYVGITLDKTSYVTLDNFQNCKNMFSQNYVCKSIDALPTSGSPMCEVKFFTEIISSIPKTCNTHFLYGTLNIWHSLTNNNWIYIQTKNKKVLIQCNQTATYDLNIIGTGILHLPENCIGFTENIQLYPKNNYVINVKVIQPTFDLINDSCCTESQFVIHKRKLKSVDLLKTNLLDITSEIKSLDPIIEDVPHIVKYSNYYSSSLYLIFCLIVILSVFMFVQNCKFGSCLGYKIYSFTQEPQSNENNISNDQVLDIPLNEVPSITPRLRTS